MLGVMRALWTLLLCAPLSAGERALTPSLPPAVPPAIALAPSLGPAPAAVSLAAVTPPLAFAPAAPSATAPLAESVSNCVRTQLPTAVPAAQASAQVAGAGSASAAAPDAAAFSASGSRLFDGLSLHGGGDGSHVWVARSLAHGRYQAAVHAQELPPRAADAPHGAVTAELRDGVLSVGLSGRGEDPALARAELSRALSLFGSGVRAVEGGWTVARWARGEGFTKALASADPKTLLFVRPRDTLKDKDGRSWRRARVLKSRGALWERYERDGRVIWLTRQKTGTEAGVWEYPGDALPVAGTPAAALAVFSLRDGTLSSYASAGSAVLLDPERERASAHAELSRP